MIAYSIILIYHIIGKLINTEFSILMVANLYVLTLEITESNVIISLTCFVLGCPSKFGLFLHFC